MTASNPSTDLVLPLRPHAFDHLAEARQLQLTLAASLPPVCPAHGDPATGPKDEFLRFWGKPGSYRQEGAARLLLEVVKKDVLGSLVSECNEPTAMIKARWPQCAQCSTRNDARTRKEIAFWMCTLAPMTIGLGLLVAAPSVYAWLTAFLGFLFIFLMAHFHGPIFAGTDRYLTASLAPDASAVTLRVHPEFARACPELDQAR
ncbi:hypothetical protein ACFC06_24085 [Nocardia sp. NPDC056064]|uniref:hypothetical protein n=1 Tax=Nocardia sp. NPDC056064 TaxID=3345701 RepID=UPI0035D97B1D